MSLTVACQYCYPSGFSVDVDFSTGRGVTALFGPSGSGKTTVIKLIAGLLQPDSGAVELGDRVLVDTRRRIWTRPEQRRIGVVFQESLLFPHRTVRSNLRYGARRSSRGNISLERVATVLELGDLLDRYPQSLSGGQQRRVALGRALLRNPELLLLDEPLTGLDLALRDRILEYLERTFHEWNIPVLLVSHDQITVRRLAQQTIVLHQGQVIESGSTQATLDRATIRDLPWHPGPVNLLRVDQLQSEGEHTEGVVGQQPFYLPRKVNGTQNTAYVRIDASDVALSEEEPVLLSVRNRLRGQVQEVVCLAESDRAFVLIDVGQPLWAEVTRAACQQLRLEPGRSILCLVKAAAVHLVE